RGNRLPLPERIAQGLWPHGNNVSIPYRPRRDAPSFDTLPWSIQVLMRRCFEDGHRDPGRRPTAAKWDAALEAETTSWLERAGWKGWLALAVLTLPLLFFLDGFVGRTLSSGTEEGNVQEGRAPEAPDGPTPKGGGGTEADVQQGRSAGPRE